MKCKDLKYNYPDYINEKVDIELKNIIEEHLSKCDRCFNEVIQLKNSKSLLDSYTPPKPDDKYFINFLPILNEKIKNKKLSTQIPQWLNKFAIPFASLTIILILLFTNVNFNENTLTNNNDDIIYETNGYNLGEKIIFEPIDLSIQSSENYSLIIEKANELLAKELLNSEYEIIFAVNSNHYFSNEFTGLNIEQNLTDEEVESVIKKMESKTIIK